MVIIYVYCHQGIGGNQCFFMSKQELNVALSGLAGRWHKQFPVAVILRVVGAGIIAPEPAEHFGEHRAALFVRVRADAPAVIQIVTLLGQGGSHLDVLRVPVPFRIVGRFAATCAAIVVESVLQKNAERFVIGGADEVGINVSAANVREAADGADDFVELIGPLPRDGERADRAAACTGDGAVVGIF